MNMQTAGDWMGRMGNEYQMLRPLWIYFELDGILGSSYRPSTWASVKAGVVELIFRERSDALHDRDLEELE